MSLSKTAVWMTVLSLALAGGVAIALFLFDPSRTPIYPGCQFHKFTGWHCPGCGSLRALHHLTHGELAAAFRCNPLLVLSLPLLAGWAASRLLRRRNPPAPLPISFKPATLWVVLGVIVLFGILRNLPHPAFAWMSP
jgi:hypothetical protein